MSTKVAEPAVDPAVMPGLSTALAGVTAAVVVGEPTAAALHAIATARSVARTRVVTIVDLIGDVAALRALSADDDPHGVADCFVYGISPKAVTRATRASERLFVIPGGSEPMAHQAVLSNTRWGRLINEYRLAGALLLFVAAVRTPGLAELIAQTDGVIAVGAIDALLPRSARILATAADTPGRRRAPRPASAPAPRGGIWRQRSAAAIAAAIVVAAGVWMWTARPTHQFVLVPSRPASQSVASAASHTDTVTSTAQLAPAAVVDSGQVGFARQIATMPRYADALLRLRHDRATLPAATIVPVVSPDGSRSFVLLAGAYRDSASAAGGGAVVHVPLALLLANGLSADSADARVRRYIARGIPAYALRAADGGVSVYAGAFQSADDAAPLSASLRAAGLTPRIANRTGQPL